MVDVRTDRKKFAVHVLQFAGLTSYLVSLREVRQPQRVEEESRGSKTCQNQAGKRKTPDIGFPGRPGYWTCAFKVQNLAGAEVGMVIQVWVFAREAKMIGNIV